jgi:hypothetical protein
MGSTGGSSCGICSGQCLIETGVPMSTLVFSQLLFYEQSKVIHLQSLLYILHTYNLTK